MDITELTVHELQEKIEKKEPNNKRHNASIYR